jgi:hypothetical protein
LGLPFSSLEEKSGPVFLSLNDDELPIKDIKLANIISSKNIPIINSNDNFLSDDIANDKLLITWELNRPKSCFVSDDFLDNTVNNTITKLFHKSDLKSKDYKNENGLIVEYNPVIMALTGSNQAIYPLFNSDSCKEILHYMVKYMTKDKFELNQVCSSMLYAKKYGDLFPSKAEDSGTKERKTKLVISKVFVLY